MQVLDELEPLWQPAPLDKLDCKLVVGLAPAVSFIAECKKCGRTVLQTAFAR